MFTNARPQTRPARRAAASPGPAAWLSWWLVLTLSVAAPVRAGDVPPALDTTVCAPDGIAVGGYDLVAYHKADGPQPGSAEFAVEHEGLTYLFATRDHQQTFSAAPDRYLPSYRGWCSTNLSMGRLACPDYTNFKLEDGQLLLFERVGFTNGRDVWDSNPSLHRRQANDNFLRFSKVQPGA